MFLSAAGLAHYRLSTVMKTLATGSVGCLGGSSLDVARCRTAGSLASFSKLGKIVRASGHIDAITETDSEANDIRLRSDLLEDFASVAATSCCDDTTIVSSHHDVL